MMMTIMMQIGYDAHGSSSVDYYQWKRGEMPRIHGQIPYNKARAQRPLRVHSRANARSQAGVLWGTAGTRRIGEASNPGPAAQHLTVIGVNVTALHQRWPAIEQWDADIVLMAETRLGDDSQRAMNGRCAAAGWSTAWGAPQPLAAPTKQEGKRASRPSIWNVRQGGVGIIAKEPVILIAQTPAQIDMPLWQTARWTHAAVPINGGSTALHTITFYGVPGASSDTLKWTENERMLREVFGHAASLNGAPTVIYMDANIDPEQSDVLTLIAESTSWHDIAAELAGEDGPAPTYRKEGPYPGMTGAGCTRIDMMYLNSAAWAAIDTFGMDYNTDVPSHVPLRTRFDLDAFKAMGWVLVQPKPFSVEHATDYTHDEDQENEQVQQGCDNIELHKIYDALADANFDLAWRIWNQQAEKYMEHIIDNPDDNNDNTTARHHGNGPPPTPRRGNTPTYKHQSVCPPVHRHTLLDGGARHRTLAASKLQRQVREFTRKRVRQEMTEAAGLLLGPEDLQQTIGAQSEQMVPT